MKKSQKDTVICEVCKRPKKMSESFPLEMVHEPIMTIIQKEHPGLSKMGYICSEDLNKYRIEFIKKVLEEEKGELSELEEEVVRSMKEQETVSKDINAEYEQRVKFADRLSDKLAVYAGSWKFIIGFITNIVLPLVIFIKFRVHINELKTKIQGWYFYNSKSKSKKVISDCTSGFRAIRSEHWQKLKLVSEGFQIETEMLYELRKHRVLLTEVPISCKWNGHYSSLSITRDGFKTIKLLTKKLASDLKKM